MVRLSVQKWKDCLIDVSDKFLDEKLELIIIIYTNDKKWKDCSMDEPRTNINEDLRKILKQVDEEHKYMINIIY